MTRLLRTTIKRLEVPLIDKHVPCDLRYEKPCLNGGHAYSSSYRFPQSKVAMSSRPNTNTRSCKAHKGKNLRRVTLQPPFHEYQASIESGNAR